MWFIRGSAIIASWKLILIPG